MFVELANFNGLRVDEPGLNGNHCRMVKMVANYPKFLASQRPQDISCRLF